MRDDCDEGDEDDVWDEGIDVLIDEQGREYIYQVFEDVISEDYSLVEVTFNKQGKLTLLSQRDYSTVYSVKDYTASQDTSLQLNDAYGFYSVYSL